MFGYFQRKRAQLYATVLAHRAKAQNEAIPAKVWVNGRDTPVVILITGLQATGKLLEYALQTTDGTDIGTEGLDLNHIQRVEPCVVPRNDSITWEQLYAKIRALPRQYDRRYLVYRNSAGVDMYYNANCRIDQPERFQLYYLWRVGTELERFIPGAIRQELLPYHQGQWFLDEPQESEVPDFTYYSWMGKQVSEPPVTELKVKENVKVVKTLDDLISETEGLVKQLKGIRAKAVQLP